KAKRRKRRPYNGADGPILNLLEIHSSFRRVGSLQSSNFLTSNGMRHSFKPREFAMVAVAVGFAIAISQTSFASDASQKRSKSSKSPSVSNPASISENDKIVH